MSCKNWKRGKQELEIDASEGCDYFFLVLIMNMNFCCVSLIEGISSLQLYVIFVPQCFLHLKLCNEEYLACGKRLYATVPVSMFI